MDRFDYIDGKLFAEDVPVSKIAAEVGTPVYIYSKATFLDHLKKIQGAFSQIDTTICFSIKACSNINILKFMAAAGSGFDIVSGGELYRAKQAGADMSKVVYAGVGKTDREILEALQAGIGYFNIESEDELENIIKIAKANNLKTKAALRVNPDVDYGAKAQTNVGVKDTKFGVDIERAKKVFAQYGNDANVDLCAIHVHLGSEGKKAAPYSQALEKIVPLIDDLRADGYRIEAIDMGGGYGADYETGTAPPADRYAEAIVPLLKGKDLKLILEPGASIAANAAILLTRVLYLKMGQAKKFVIVDAGMNDLIRPPLYGSFHFIWPAQVESKFMPGKREKEMAINGTEVVDIVGPICESTDFFANARSLAPVERGELVAIFTAGAYGYTMSSNYNSRPLLPEVLVDGKNFEIIRKRQTYEDLVALEK